MTWKLSYINLAFTSSSGPPGLIGLMHVCMVQDWVIDWRWPEIGWLVSILCRSPFLQLRKPGCFTGWQQEFEKLSANIQSLSGLRFTVSTQSFQPISPSQISSLMSTYRVRKQALLPDRIIYIIILPGMWNNGAHFKNKVTMGMRCCVWTQMRGDGKRQLCTDSVIFMRCFIKINFPPFSSVKALGFLLR